MRLRTEFIHRKDFDRNIVIDERTQQVAKKVSEFLKGYDRYAKTIIFCVDINHAELMRQALINENADLANANDKYIMQITGDNDEGKRELDNFIDPEQRYPVIATTSELMTTGVDAQTCKVIVLDSNITSMTKFKQIIGRGTRINEDFGKYYFTIIDFRNATDLFADKDFDGEPIRVKPISNDVDLGTIIDEEETDTSPVIDDVTGEDITDGLTPEKPQIRYPEDNSDPGMVKEPRKKVFVNQVDVTLLIERELYFDSQGKPITGNLKDYTRNIIKGQFTSLGDFISHWNTSERKEAIIKELEEQGVLVNALLDAVDRQCDLFDLICHVAYDQPPLTRKERANNVKKRNYFSRYGENACKVLEALLDKYADEGIENIESIEVLRLQPLSDMGSPIEIINEFGNKQSFQKAVSELEAEVYRTA
ncbi:MAG: hypothetical protein JXB00_18770 [Bacteroidales bacterium]|nr:hypothetical protein [Bacteroidales bacterium]